MSSCFRAIRIISRTVAHILLPNPASIYEGVNGVVVDWNSPPVFPRKVEVFKFDFDGNLLKDYLLDRYVYTLSIDGKEEYMYCTARNSYDEEPYLIRYKLK